MQFYAIEIARNRNGLNDWIYENYQKEQAGAKAKDAKSWWMNCTTTTLLVHIQQAVEWLRIAKSRRVEDPSIAATPEEVLLMIPVPFCWLDRHGVELLILRIWTFTQKIPQWQNHISNIFAPILKHSADPYCRHVRKSSTIFESFILSSSSTWSSFNIARLI